ncbi:MAG: DegT/DnrJ/EryC1/StrS family aminotransferase, partial [Rhodopirellula sp. JB053]
CSSGSAAVELSLRGVGVKPGDEVIVAAYDYPGNFRTIELLGGKPVLVDVRANGVTIDPASLEQIHSDSVRAVIVSHLYGELADVLSIRKICDERGWHLIEDACQVPGAGWCSNTGNGSDSPQGSQETDAGFVPVGALADVVAYSFGGSKLLSAGNGGAVVTRDPRVAARLKSYVDRPSDAYAFSALQSAVILPQLSTLRNYNERRTAMAVRMNARDWGALNAHPACEINADVPASIYKYALVADSQPQAGRDHLIEQLRRIGLPVGKGFRSLHATSPQRSSKPVPLHRSQVLGENCVVIDHRALLADNLIERLKQVET